MDTQDALEFARTNHRAAMIEQQRVVLRIRPERVGPTVAG
jgi:hypothetical protein